LPCSLLPEQNDAVNGAVSPLNDAFAFGLTFWNLYQEWYDMPPLNEKLGLVVHYGEGNAMWDGRKMYFSDGDSRYHPYVSVDVVAHEVSHGTTQHNSNLVYRDQSGGINEAFSDMAGATAEFFYFGTTEFEMGNKIRKQSGAMRYMCDPERDGRSIGHVDDYRQGMDVHHSSGVFNKVFCTLSNKPDWDPRKAFHVFLVANRVYWDRNTNFEDGANDAIQASVDLVGPTICVKRFRRSALSVLGAMAVSQRPRLPLPRLPPDGRNLPPIRRMSQMETASILSLLAISL